MATLQNQADRAARLLEAIYNQLNGHESPEAQKYLEELTKLQKYATKPSAVIGIIGATGAGQSALINALLEEEHIRPISCMRACTAVVTEISYNTSEIPYRAEIEFIGKAQCGKISSEVYSDGDSEAAIAYAKIKGVYPNMTRDQLARSSIEELMSHESIIHLDTTKIIEERDAGGLYKKLQVYIDSREKFEHRGKANKNEVKALEYWPLIRVVRLFIKSRTLETGAIIVDLPGVQDSNAARAAVAQSYLKQCSGLFIMAPITRAVDDKLAKTLLGRSFKQQLKLDGNFGNVTFICSKTDIIIISEAQESLQLDVMLQPLHKNLNRLQKSFENLDAEHLKIEAMVATANDAIHSADADLDTWQNLRVRADAGSVVYMPLSAVVGAKRKRTRAFASSRKKSTIQSYFEEDSDSDAFTEQQCDEDELDNAFHHPQSAGAPVLKDQIELKIAELKEKKAAARKEYHELGQKVKSMGQQSRQFKIEHKEMRNKIDKICISARNEYARTAIKMDFAAGVKEIDQELEEELDPEAFDPTHEIRDYDMVAKDLPVFCVSSHGYQKLSGRLKAEKRARGFENLNDTEVPQLQDHCRAVAEALRNSSAETLIAKTSVLCNSMRIWASGYNQQHDLTTDELTRMQEALTMEIEDFSKNLLALGAEGFNEISEAITTHIYAKFSAAVTSAKDQALVAVGKWARPIDRDNRAKGGLNWSTYRATVRRNGCFPKKQIVHDFNQELADPLIVRLTPGWDRVFSHCVPMIFKDAPSQYGRTIADFHAKITLTAVKYGISLESLQLLGQQLKLHNTNIRLALNASKSDIRKGQKGINRQFTPAIAQDMSEIYAACAAERGNGMYMRIKNIMEAGVRDSSQDMFQSCVDNIERNLRDMMKDIEEDFKAKVEEIISSIARDYMQLCAKKSEQILEEEKVLKDTVIFFVNNYEAGECVTGSPIAAEASNVTDATIQMKIKSEITTESPVRHGLAMRSATPRSATPIVGQAHAVKHHLPADRFNATQPSICIKTEIIDPELMDVPYDL